VPRSFPIPCESTANTIWDPNLDPDLVRRRSVPLNPEESKESGDPFDGSQRCRDDDDSSYGSPSEKEKSSSGGSQKIYI
jgi:hypothetical protein